MSSELSYSRTLDDFFVVWLDENDSSHEHSINTLYGHAFHAIQAFDDVAKCIDFVRKAKKESVFLIISELLISKFVLQLHGLPQVHSIYIMSSHTLSLDDDYPAMHKKVRGTFSDVLSLFEHLTQDIRVAEQTLTPLSILNADLISCNDINKLDCSFICSHLLKEVTLDCSDDDVLQRQFIEFCQEKYARNQKELKIINEFDKHYHKHQPIWWYTRECFLFKIINKTLRLQDTDIFLKMKFFIRDLHLQIKEVNSSMPTNSISVLYRGQGLFNEDFERLKQNKHGILSFNNFLLTNSSRDVSLHFAQHSCDKDNIVPVLFEIHMDPSIQSTQFASLNKIGYFPTDSDFLFSMHAVFRIQDTQYMKNGIWKIQLTAISDKDPQLQSLVDLLQCELKGSNAMHRLGSFLLKTHQWDKAHDIFEFIRDDGIEKSQEDLADIESSLGKTCEEKNELKRSLRHYQQSLKIKLTYLTDKDPKLASAYTRVALLFQKLGELDLSMEQFQCALHIYQNSSDPNQHKLIMCYISMSDLLRQLNRPDEAREYLESALQIQLNLLSSTHPDLIKTRSHLYDIYYSVGDYVAALEQAKALLRIIQKSYPVNDFQIAIGHYNIANTLDKLERYQEALKEIETAVKIGHRTHSSGDPEMSDMENLLEMVRWKNSQLFDST